MNMINNLTKTILESGGSIHQLVIPSEYTGGMGICNPSVYKDGEDLLVNLRNVEYVLYHGEGEQKFQTRWGPLAYIHPEDDLRLKTINFLCKLDPDNFNITECHRVNTSKLDVAPIWTFVGLEDARVVRWNNKLYLSGVRRDTTTNGEGRMELSEIENNKEISRVRTKPPTYSYCEKNWMPVTDLPYHYVKWCNPTEVVSVDPETGEAKQVVLKPHNFAFSRDQRGGSQVIPYKGYRIALLHEVELYKTEGGFKDAQYYHRFLVWDKDWNLVSYSEDFKFFTSNIEFACGMTIHDENVLISAGLQDNAAYLIRIPLNFFDDFIGISNKLENFPTVVYVGHELYKDRISILEKELNKYKLDYIPIILDSKTDRESIFVGKYEDKTDDQGKWCIASHLRAMKYWYENYYDDFVVFTEDDISFETVKYWNFTWEQFMKGLPNNWDCIQLCRMREHENAVEFRLRQWDDWSAAAYLVTRKYVKKLLDTYYSRGEFLIEVPGTNLLPCTETMFFTQGITYSFPLLVESRATRTTRKNNKDSVNKIGVDVLDSIDNWHDLSAKFILGWWRAGQKTPKQTSPLLLQNMIYDTYDEVKNILLAEQYFSQQQYASALTFFLKVCDNSKNNDIIYECLIKIAKCFGRLGRRPASEETAFLNAVNFQPHRPEAYLALSNYYTYYGKWTEAYNFATIGYSNRVNKKVTITNIEYKGDYIFLYILALSSNKLGRIEESRKRFLELAEKHSGELVGSYKETTKQAVAILGNARPLTFKYVKSLGNKLKVKFSGYENIGYNYAQVFQDMFVLSMLNGKREGTYLEIGSGDPFVNSNTALLEFDFGWKGLSIEIKADEVDKFKKARKNTVLQADALKLDYVSMLSQHNLPSEIDYLQLDCEPAEATYEILTKIPFDKYKFAVITYEHDNYATLDKIYKEKSRKFLELLGYKLVISNVGRNNVDDFEDWWVHPDLVDNNIIDLMLDTTDSVKNMNDYIFIDEKFNKKLFSNVNKSNFITNPKLANFPIVNFISLKDSPDRTQSIKNLLTTNNIKFRPHIVKRYAEGDCNILGEGIYRLKTDSKGALVAHFKVLKDWYNTTQEEYAFVCEDDISLETIDYWDFTWDEFINSLPVDWEFVQLMQLKERIVEFRLRTRDFFDWSAGAYIVKRDYVKRLLDKYYYDDSLHIHTGNMLPIAENVLFWGLGRTYTIPLFVEDYNKLGTSGSDKASPQVEQYYYNIHVNSRNSVLDWWKTKGCVVDLRFLLTPPESGIDWGNVPYDYKLFFFREMFVNRVYEELASVQEGDIVMDIGSNVGSFTYSILEKNPKHVYCIEPSKDLFPTLVKNTNRPNVTQLNKAISDVNDNYKELTDDIKISNYTDNHYEAITFDKVIKDFGIEKVDFMKIDCEGGEYYVFTEDNYDFIMNNVKNIAGEWHIWGADDLKDKFKKFRDLYLKNHKDFLVLDLQHNNITNSIFDNDFVDNFAKTSYVSQFMVYMRN